MDILDRDIRNTGGGGGVIQEIAVTQFPRIENGYWLVSKEDSNLEIIIKFGDTYLQI